MLFRGFDRNNSLHHSYENDVLFCDKHVKFLMDLLRKNMVSHAAGCKINVCVLRMCHSAAGGVSRRSVD